MQILCVFYLYDFFFFAFSFASTTHGGDPHKQTADINNTQKNGHTHTRALYLRNKQTKFCVHLNFK